MNFNVFYVISASNFHYNDSQLQLCKYWKIYCSILQNHINLFVSIEGPQAYMSQPNDIKYAVNSLRLGGLHIFYIIHYANKFRFLIILKANFDQKPSIKSEK